MEETTQSLKPVRKAGRWMIGVATLLTGFAGVLYGVGSDLLTFAIPIRTVALTSLLLSLGLVGLRLVRRPRTAPSVFVLVLAMVTLGLAIVVYAREFRAYQEVDLAFENADTRLEGTLYLPNDPGLYPTLVIAHGSIRAPRRLYHLWADRLVRRGIAVYSFDKRGTGGSGGVYEAENNSSQENLALLASDVAAAHRVVRNHAGVARDQVGLLGISMGGWLAPLAAAELDSVSTMVLISGPPVSVGEENAYSQITGEGHEDGAEMTQAEIERLIAERMPSGFDPRPLLRASLVPALWLLGGNDTSVPTSKSTVVLDSLIEQSARTYRYVVYPEAEHLGFVMKWPFDMAPGVWEEIEDWVTKPDLRQSGGVVASSSAAQ